MSGSLEVKQAILEEINKHNETTIVGLEYAVNEDEEGFTIECTDFMISQGDGEVESVSASEHNEKLACDLNELLFAYLEEFNGEDQPQYGEIEL